jgi:hypothetical protein
MMPLAPGGAATMGAAGAEVVKEEELEILMSGDVELKVGGKWKKRFAQLAMSNATGGEMQIYRSKPPAAKKSEEELSAKERAALRPQKVIAVNSVRLSEAERSLGCVDHQNCEEFIRKLDLKVPGPQVCTAHFSAYVILRFSSLVLLSSSGTCYHLSSLFPTLVA